MYFALLLLACQNKAAPMLVVLVLCLDWVSLLPKALHFAQVSVLDLHTLLREALKIAHVCVLVRAQRRALRRVSNVKMFLMSKCTGD